LKKILFCILVTLATSVSVSAQTTVTTGPFDTSMKWDFRIPTEFNLADANGFQYRLRDVINTSLPVVVLGNITCVAPTATVPNVVCRSPLTPAMVTELNKFGKHTYSLTFYRVDIGESLTSTPFIMTSPAPAPTDLQITK
jgi:hypothetical protein